tara:strand:- start:1749 stop:2111 length:363 start_codon:yes stop_codon:yes gene_type:complete
MSQQNSTAIKKKAMIDALEKAMGVVTTAAKMAGIERTTHYKWMNDDEKYKSLVDDVQNIVLDFAESALYKMVENHNPAATLFLLKTKGKKRGYIERQEIEHSSNVETDVTFEIHERKKDS